MANSDSAQYTLRYNEITRALEICIAQNWVPVSLTNNVTITTANIDSGAATEGQLLTADGAGGATWEDPA